MLIVTGIDASDFPRVIREDIKRPGLLYAGTEHGIYVSFDDGARWHSLRLDLPVTPVHGIVVEESDLVIGTHGRSFYVLDDIAVLRQLQAELSTARTHRFAPSVTPRRVRQRVAIDYYLRDAADAVTIQMTDAEGREVRTFESAPEKKPEGKAEKAEKSEQGESAAEEPEEGGRSSAPPRVETKAGMNRFRWDMRHKPARDFKGAVLWAGSVRGPMVLPGTYQVKLTAHGETRTTTVRIARDPRLPSVTDEDVKAQHALAMDIHRRLNEANEAIVRIRHLSEQAKNRAEQARHAKVTLAVDAFAAKLKAIEGEIYQYQNRSNQDPLNYPIKLNDKLAALVGIVESGEGRPTRQSYEVFHELSSRLDAQLSALATVVRVDLPAPNRRVTARRLAPIRDQLPKAETTPVTATADEPALW